MSDCPRCAELERALSEGNARLAAVMEGQELLKAQTVRIRHAALGGDYPDSRDTEEIVRVLRAGLEAIAKLNGAKLPNPESEIDSRTCTCHPDDRPATCQKKYALRECLASAGLPDPRDLGHAVGTRCGDVVHRLRGLLNEAVGHLEGRPMSKLAYNKNRLVVKIEEVLRETLGYECPSQGLLREPAVGNGDKPFPGRPNKSPGIA